MSVVAARSLRIKRIGAGRVFVVFLAALGFLLQSYVTQTHIHDFSQGIGGASKAVTEQSPAHNKTPLDKKLADCPLCQAVVHAGVFVAPAAPLLYLPFVWIKTVTVVFTAWTASHATGHDWQSRAPPRR